jgi:endonuclease/exonuclease/phosphatase family metal-dependent hydrolase
VRRGNSWRQQRTPLYFASVLARYLLGSCVALVCLGCEPMAENYLDPLGPRYAGDYGADAQAMSALPGLSVVTFNIKFGDEYERAAEELATSPALSSADVVLLQEVDAPRADAIALRLRMAYVYYPGSVHTNGRDFGNAVLSRWPLVADSKLILPHRNPVDGRIRVAVQATIASPLGDISAYSVHTETPWLGPRARLEQAEFVISHARASGAVSIAGGDFNTSDPGSVAQTVKLFQGAGYAWASSEVGDTAGSFALDHLFVRHLTPVHAGSAVTQASDHRPTWAALELESSR